MTKNARQGLFYGLVALFLIAGTAVVLYAQGFRLDFMNGRVSKIGAIYVRAYPEGASIALDGKPVENKSGFLTPGTLISDLFPGNYLLSLAEPGYDAWRENVTVLPSLVVPLKYAVLVPQDAMAVASASVKEFLASDGAITVQDAEGNLSTGHEVVGNGTIVGATTDQSGLIFREADGSYRLFDAESDIAVNLSSVLSRDGITPGIITSLAIDPNEPNLVFVVAAGKDSLWMLNAVGSSSLTSIEKASKEASTTISPMIAISDPSLAWTRFEKASDTSELALYDRDTASLQETSTTLPGATEQVAWIHGGSLLGIVEDDGSAYLYDAGSGIARKFADDVRSFAASDDGTMIATLEHQSVEIFSPEDASVYYRFNLPDIADVQRLIWYHDDNHLFVVYPDHVSFLDLEDTGLMNFTTVASGTSPEYDPTSSSLYFINPVNQLLRLDFPN